MNKKISLLFFLCALTYNISDLFLKISGWYDALVEFISTPAIRIVVIPLILFTIAMSFTLVHKVIVMKLYKTQSFGQVQSVVIAMIIINSVIIGALIFGETLYPRHLLGTGLLLIGIVLTQIKQEEPSVQSNI